MTRRVVVHDHRGTPRSGPPGAWWLPVHEGAAECGTRPRHEIPTFRVRAWNVAAVAYLAAATVLAWRLGELVPFLVITAGLVVVCVAGLWWIHATLPTRYARQIGQPAPGQRRPARPAPDAVVRPEPVAEGVR